MERKCCDCKETDPECGFHQGQKRCKKCTSLRNKRFRELNPEYHKVGGPGYHYGKVADKKTFNKNRTEKRKDKALQYRERMIQKPRGALASVWSGIQCRCKKRGQEIEFDLDYLEELFHKQEGRCAMTGLVFDLLSSSRIKKFRPFSVSVDRVDSTKGYTKDNIRLVCVAFNLALNAFGEEIFHKMARAYIDKKNSEIVQ